MSNKKILMRNDGKVKSRANIPTISIRENKSFIVMSLFEIYRFIILSKFNANA